MGTHPIFESDFDCLTDMLGGFSGIGNDFQATPDEAAQYQLQFNSLPVVGGKLNGDAARTFFMRSGLQQQILGRIWVLSDNDKDGQLSSNEFNVAMKLVRMARQGQPLPHSIPISNFGSSHLSNQHKMAPLHTGGNQFPSQMNFQPIRPIMTGPSSFQNSNMGFTSTLQPSTAPTSSQPQGTSSLSSLNLDLSFGGSKTMPATQPKPAGFGMGQTAPPIVPGRPYDWTIKPANRLKWNQEFNRADHRKTGFLEAHVASPFLRQTGLPQISLAKIWELADQDKDGRLSSTEFVSAMALCDAAKSGQPIPEQLPAELGRGGGSSGGLGGMAANSPAKVEGGRMGLEEERRKNMEKGMAELERRRELIRQREEAERLEAEKKRQAAEAERLRKAEEAERIRREEIEKKRKEMILEKQRLQDQLDTKRHKRDQLQQEKDAQEVKQADTKKRLDEISMRLQSAQESSQGMKTQIEMKKSQMVEMGNQSATINAQIGQAKSETERIKAQVQVFQNSTVAAELNQQNQVIKRNIMNLESDSETNNSEVTSEREEKSKLEERIKSLNLDLGKLTPTPTTPQNVTQNGWSGFGQTDSTSSFGNGFGSQATD